MQKLSGHNFDMAGMLQIGHGVGGDFVPLDPAAAFDTLPTAAGTPNVDQTITITPGTSADADSFEQQYRRDGDVVSDASDLTYVLTAADRGPNFTAWQRTIKAGALPGPWTLAGTFAVTYVLPEFVGGPLPDIDFQQGLGPQVYEGAQGAFTGQQLTYSIAGAASLAIRPTADIEVDTNSIVVQAGTLVTITATNPDGSVSGTASLNIAATNAVMGGLTDGIADVESYASIDATLTNGRSIEGYKWGSTLGGSEYGTGPNPTPFSDGTLHLEVTAGTNVYSTSVTAVDILKIDIQPSFGQTSYVAGDTLVLNEGTASPSATLSVEYFRLDGVDKSGELSGLNWDSTGEAAGIVTAQIRATNVDGFVLSDEIITILNATAGATAPMINSMVVGALSGNNLPVVFDFSENEPRPYTVPIVMVPTGTTAPNSDQVAAGTDAFDNPAPFAGVHLVSAPGTATFPVGTAPSGTYDLYATIADNDGHRWTGVAVQTGIVLNFSTLAVTILDFYGSNVSELTVDFTIDTTGGVAGDHIILPFGVLAHPTSVTVQEAGEAAVAAAQIGVNPTAGASTWISGHLFTLTKDGGPGTIVSVVKSAASNSNVLVPMLVKGGTVATSGAAVNHVYRSSTSSVLSAPVTPTGSGIVIAFAMGPDSYINGSIVWAGDMTFLVTDGPANPSNRKATFATYTNPDTAPVDVLFTPATGGPMSLMAISISED